MTASLSSILPTQCLQTIIPQFADFVSNSISLAMTEPMTFTIGEGVFVREI